MSTCRRSSPAGIAIGLALVSTAVAYLLYFGLIVCVGPTKTHTVMFLIPGFGLGWGVLLLGETVGPGATL